MLVCVVALECGRDKSVLIR